MIDGVKALTFDTGGTILDWHSGIEAKLAEIGARRGVEADWAAVTNTYRRRSLTKMTGGAADFQPAFNIDDVHREQIEIVAGEHGLSAFTASDFDDVRDAWHSLACWPDVPAGLAWLRTKYLVASLTILSFRLIMTRASRPASSGMPCSRVRPSAFASCGRRRINAPLCGYRSSPRSVSWWQPIRAILLRRRASATGQRWSGVRSNGGRTRLRPNFPLTSGPTSLSTASTNLPTSWGPSDPAGRLAHRQYELRHRWLSGRGFRLRVGGFRACGRSRQRQSR